ncbi:uncharacterized protein UV8b_05527 [Ustilaginoidea virens]|nr:uncharacterized protein UV8b_05527 [Ustilaginoidea virens]QUC21284.1 hypothetical protein UV8b_05527 [Ustilaginoidea virens]
MDSQSMRRPCRRDSDPPPSLLLQLDPSPIDSPSSAADEKTMVFASDEADSGTDAGPRAPGTAGAPGLHGGRRAVFYLSRLQRYSSYAMGVFTTLHLASVSLIPLVTRSVPGSETYLLMTREIYQTTPVAEGLLVALPVAAHVASGVALRLLRRWQNMRRYGGGAPGAHALGRLRDALSGTPAASVRLWPRMSYVSLSGYALTLFYGAHVLVNRVLPLLVEGGSSDIGLGFVAHGFARRPVLACVAYGGLLAAASGHMVWGMAKWSGVAPGTPEGWRAKDGAAADGKARRLRRRKWLGVQAVAAGVAMLWAAGGLGVVARGGLANGWVRKVYDELLGRVGM